MKKVLHLAACVTAAALVLSLAACGNSASSAAQSEAPASSVSAVVEATTPQSVPSPDTMSEETISGTVVGASMNNITITTNDGKTVTFPTVDAEVTAADGLLEGDWVTVTYKGTITDDMAAVEVISVEDGTDHAQAEIDATTFTDAGSAKMYTTGPIHVRSSYSTNSAVVTTLPKGTEVEVIGEAPNGWKQIRYNGQDYYMFGEYLTATAPANPLDDATGLTVQATSGTVYTTVNLRMRSEPAVAGTVLGTAKAGTALIRTGVIGDWTQVEYDGGVAYCDTEYLVTAPTAETVVTVAEGLPAGVEKTSTDETMYTTFALHMRASCSTDSTIIGTAPKGSAVHVTGVLNNGWYEVQYGGRTAYCVAQFLSNQAPAATNESATMNDQTDVVYSITKLHVRQDPSLGGQILGTVTAGTEMERTGISADGQWSRVSFEGNTGYCATQYLTTSAVEGGSPTVQTVNQTVRTTADLRIHTTASLDSQVLGVVPAGTSLNRIGILSNGWSQVYYNGVPAYCASQYLG